MDFLDTPFVLSGSAGSSMSAANVGWGRGREEGGRIEGFANPLANCPLIAGINETSNKKPQKLLRHVNSPKALQDYFRGSPRGAIPVPHPLPGFPGLAFVFIRRFHYRYTFVAIVRLSHSARLELGLCRVCDRVDRLRKGGRVAFSSGPSELPAIPPRVL